MLSLYRRHTKACPYHSRTYRRCKYPLWVQGTLAGQFIPKALDLASWDAGQTLVREWETTGRITRGVRAKREMQRRRPAVADC